VHYNAELFLKAIGNHFTAVIETFRSVQPEHWQRCVEGAVLSGAIRKPLLERVLAKAEAGGVRKISGKKNAGRRTSGINSSFRWKDFNKSA
jgi:hypothetical protein